MPRYAIEATETITQTTTYMVEAESPGSACDKVVDGEYAMRIPFPKSTRIIKQTINSVEKDGE